jgi:uncharacterized protein (DUF1697 family)
MPTCIALLRGVNLAGRKMVPMSELRAMAETLKLANVRTLLQSGNLVFRSTKRATALETLLEGEIERRLGLHTEVMVRTEDEWRSLIAANPFTKEAKDAPSYLLVHVMRVAPTREQLATLRRAIVGRERIEIDDRHAYIVYPDGVGQSRLSTALLDRHFGSRGTARNWNTVTKLAAML